MKGTATGRPLHSILVVLVALVALVVLVFFSPSRPGNPSCTSDARATRFTRATRTTGAASGTITPLPTKKPSQEGRASMLASLSYLAIQMLTRFLSFSL